MWPLVFLLGLLAGCGSGFGATNHVQFITTDGTGSAGSPPGTRMTLYGPDSPIIMAGTWGSPDTDAKQIVEDTAIVWLQKRGMIVVDTRSREQVRHEQIVALSNDDHLRIGRLSGADVLVLRTYSRPLATVTVKGISVETGEVLWTGSASTTPNGNPADLKHAQYGLGWRGLTIGNPSKDDWNKLASAPVLRALTCRALAAAFRLPPTNPSPNPDRVCDLP